MEAKITASRKTGQRRPKGYADWRPQRKTLELIANVERIIADYEEYLPLTVRQLFYLLVGNYAYDKTENAYERLCEKVVRARRARMIPFNVIRDDGVVSHSSPWFDGPDAFWDETGRRARRYRRNRQAGQRQFIEVWCEAAGMAPQLARVADLYSVPVFSAGGFGSLTSTRLVAERALDRSVPTVLLHVGDLDPSGESIFESLAADAAAFVEADRVVMTTRVEAERVALRPEQVEQHDLETAPPKKTDSRARHWQGETCQLEALPPDTLAGLLNDAILDHLDLDRLTAEIDRENEDRTELLGALPAGDEETP